MPWDIQQRNDQWVVVKHGTDEIMGTHKTKSEARAQQRALYANVKESADGLAIVDPISGETIATLTGPGRQFRDAMAVHDFLVATQRMTDADLSEADLRALLAKGQAFRKDDGTPAYPTPTLEYWGKALHAYGRSLPKERARLRAYLTKRGTELGAPKEAIARISKFT